jgi:hypothetical protein
VWCSRLPGKRGFISRGLHPLVVKFRDAASSNYSRQRLSAATASDEGSAQVQGSGNWHLVVLELIATSNPTSRRHGRCRHSYSNISILHSTIQYPQRSPNSSGMDVQVMNGGSPSSGSCDGRFAHPTHFACLAIKKNRVSGLGVVQERSARHSMVEATQ